MVDLWRSGARVRHSRVGETWLHLLVPTASDMEEGNRDGQLADRRLCAVVGLPVGGAGQAGRLGGLAVLSAFSTGVGVCRQLDPAGGRFAIRPAGEFQARRRYVDQTMVLETTFTTAGGTVVLTDALAVGRNERGHDLGARSPGVLLRRLACTGGEIEAEVTHAPRPE